MNGREIPRYLLPVALLLLAAPAALPLDRALADDGRELRVFSGFPAQSRQHRTFTGTYRDSFERNQPGVRLVVEPRAPDATDSAAARLERGKLVAAALTPPEAAGLLPGALAYARPFRFCSSGEIRAVRRAFDQRMLALLSGDAHRAVAVIGLDSLHFLSERPVQSPGELSERTLWLPDRFEGLREYFSAWGVDAATFDRGGDIEARVRDDPDAVYANFPLALILDDELPRPAFISRQPVSHLYFLLVVDLDRMNQLATPLREDLERYLDRVATRIDALNTEAAATARDILRRGAGMQSRTIGDWPAFARRAREDRSRTPTGRELGTVIERVRDERDEGC